MSLPRPGAPASIDQLLARADALAGLTLDRAAGRYGLPVPADLSGHKGWVGHLLEYALGARAGSLDVPDFPHLGVELKTLPVDSSARPRQSTWVTHAPQGADLAASWRESAVYRKLRCVLWIPIVWDGTTPLAQRHLGAPLLWSPNEEQEALLRRDWQDLTDMIREGELDRITARLGVALQVRPKAANAAQTTWALDGDGAWIETLPRGFYLRPSFTAALLAEAFGA